MEQKIGTNLHGLRRNRMLKLVSKLMGIKYIVRGKSGSIEGHKYLPNKGVDMWTYPFGLSHPITIKDEENLFFDVTWEDAVILSLDSIKDVSSWDKRQNRPRILFDMDDVITNFLGFLLAIYNTRMKTDVKIEEFKSWNLTDTVGPEILNMFKEEGFFSLLPEKRESTSVLKQLIDSKMYDVFIITACTSARELGEKIEWFQRVLPSFDVKRIISCSEKEIIRGDLIVDDKVENLERCAPYMKCILFDMPHNSDCNQFIRVDTLRDIPDLLEEMFYPKYINVSNLIGDDTVSLSAVVDIYKQSGYELVPGKRLMDGSYHADDFNQDGEAETIASFKYDDRYTVEIYADSGFEDKYGKVVDNLLYARFRDHHKDEFVGNLDPELEYSNENVVKALLNIDLLVKTLVEYIEDGVDADAVAKIKRMYRCKLGTELELNKDFSDKQYLAKDFVFPYTGSKIIASGIFQPGWTFYLHANTDYNAPSSTLLYINVIGSQKSPSIPIGHADAMAALEDIDELIRKAKEAFELLIEE